MGTKVGSKTVSPLHIGQTKVRYKQLEMLQHPQAIFPPSCMHGTACCADILHTYLSPGHPTAPDETWYWLKRVLDSG